MTTIGPVDPFLYTPVGTTTMTRVQGTIEDGAQVSQDVGQAFEGHVPGVEGHVPSVPGRMPSVTENGGVDPSQITDNQGISGNRSVENESPASGIESFADALRDAMGVVNDVQVGADQVSQDFASGKRMQIHEAMLAMEKATITLKFLGSVRNRMLEAYQEVMRMNV